MSMGDMMKKKMVGTIGETLSIPAEALGNTAYIEIRGKNTLSVENHRGIAEYTSERICICVKRGQISIEGNELRIICMNHRRIEVSGELKRVELA